MNSSLLDRICEAPFAPDLWPGILDDLACIADARGGELFLTDGTIMTWTASDIMRDSMERAIAGDWLRRGERLPRLIRVQHAGFITEPDVFTEAERLADPIYRDLLIPAGLGWAAAMGIALPTGNLICLCLEREGTRGPVEPAIIRELDVWRPHLARSALLSVRLQLERARTITETLARLGLPALVLGDQGRVLAANPLIEALTSHISWRARDRVSLRDPAADTLLQQTIRQLDHDAPAAVQSFVLRADFDEAPLIAHVVPIRGSARDIFVRCTSILVMTPVALRDAPPAEIIRSLFDLSAAEARVARHLVSGSTVNEIAAVDGVSSNTVRTQVRGVLEKTGCRRQAEVVALLSGLSVPRD